MAGPRLNTYYATKNYSLKLTMAIYEELRQMKSNVKISALCPGPVDTEFFDVAGQKQSNAVKEAVTVKATEVVKQALLDARDGKEMSVYGAPMKVTKAATKVMPHSVLLKAMKRFW